MRCTSAPPAGIIPAGARAATRDMAISLAPVALGDLRMLPNASVYLSDPQLPDPEQTLGVRLSQLDHRSLHTTKAFVRSAGIPEVGLAQRNAERSNNFLPCQGFVEVPDFEGLLRDQRPNFSLFFDHLFEHCPSFADTLIASPDLAGGECLGVLLTSFCASCISFFSVFFSVSFPPVAIPQFP